MAKLRNAPAYRRLERPYTRISKYKKKSFVKSRPNMVISKYDMGNVKNAYIYTLYLASNEDIQIRHNSLEAARQTATRLLEKEFGVDGFYLKLLLFPHHILRENPLASGAGADRLSTGMAGSFGKVISTAARIHAGQHIFRVQFNDKNKFEIAKKALHKAAKKLPKSCTIVNATPVIKVAK